MPDKQTFRQLEMQRAFGDNEGAQTEIGADRWYLILYDIGPIAVIVTETGGLWKLSLTGYNFHLKLEDEFDLLFSARVSVLHAITEAQRVRAYEMKRANAKLRKSFTAQLRALRSARQHYDAMVARAPAIVR